MTTATQPMSIDKDDYNEKLAIIQDIEIQIQNPNSTTVSEAIKQARDYLLKLPLHTLKKHGKINRLFNQVVNFADDQWNGNPIPPYLPFDPTNGLLPFGWRLEEQVKTVKKFLTSDGLEYTGVTIDNANMAFSQAQDEFFYRFDSIPEAKLKQIRIHAQVFPVDQATDPGVVQNDANGFFGSPQGFWNIRYVDASLAQYTVNFPGSTTPYPDNHLLRWDTVDTLSALAQFDRQREYKTYDNWNLALSQFETIPPHTNTYSWTYNMENGVLLRQGDEIRCTVGNAMLFGGQQQLRDLFITIQLELTEKNFNRLIKTQNTFQIIIP